MNINLFYKIISKAYDLLDVIYFRNYKGNVMRQLWKKILLGLMFLTGFGIMIYPTVSNQWNTYQQNKLITNYQETVTDMEAVDFSAEWSLARKFNDTIEQGALYTDAFGIAETDIEETEYWKVLNVADDGVMGYISIPKINVELGIYHGTEEDVLQTGIGHINGTKLPIGGESNHCVLSGHRGLPSAKLFTDLDQMEEGDVFYLHVLDETLAYQVDQILDMVDKNDAEALEEAMAVVEGEDYVTLFTCTPYGINSHRLLVRGTRIPYDGEGLSNESASDTMVESIQDYYMIYLILGVAVVALVIVTIKFVLKRKNKKENN